MKRIWICGFMVKLKAAYESRQIRIRSTYRFSELNRTQFKNLVRKYDGNRYVKQFTCCNQLLAMMFGQLSNRESLRDIIAAFEVNRAKNITLFWTKFYCQSHSRLYY